MWAEADGYTALFEKLDPTPDAGLLAEAEAEAKGTRNPCFARFLRDKMEEKGSSEMEIFTYETWKTRVREEIHEPLLQASMVCKDVDQTSICTPGLARGIYEGHCVDVSVLELGVTGRDLFLGTSKDSRNLLDLDEVYSRGAEDDGGSMS